MCISKKVKKEESAHLVLDERGTVESALVLLPLMILVLSVLQIALGVLSRGVAGNSTQSAVIKSSLFSPNGASPLVLMRAEGVTRSSEIPLAGGGTLFLGETDNKAPSLTPLLPRGDYFTSVGISVGEGS